MGVLEQYNLNTNAWASIDSPPLISSLAYAGSATAADPAGGETITVTGSNFQSGATVKVGETSATSVTVVSTTSITFTTPIKTAGDYDVVVTNANGLIATLSNGISYNGVPMFTTAAGNLGELVNNDNVNYYYCCRRTRWYRTQSITSDNASNMALYFIWWCYYWYTKRHHRQYNI